MVLITATAQAQLEALERHYAKLGRDEAAIRMVEAVAMAAVRIEEQAGPFWPAPRPYSDLADLGWRWLRRGGTGSVLFRSRTVCDHRRLL